MAPFRFLTAGESHGGELGVIVEGVPAGLALTTDDLARDLARRQLGYGRGARQAIESDRAEIVAGVRHGRTIGSPIQLRIVNRDAPNWTRVMQVEPLDAAARDAVDAAVAAGDRRSTPVTRVRPGHADLAGAIKYGHSDVRDVLERASARETAARVAAGGIARAFLRYLGIDCWSFTAEVGGVAMDPANATRTQAEADVSPLRCPDPEAEARMIARIDEARANGDTVGGVFEVVATGVPIGFRCWSEALNSPSTSVSTLLLTCARSALATPAVEWPKRLIGILLSALAISLGAAFWFELLNRLVSLRGAGAKPKDSTTDNDASRSDGA